MKIKLLNDGGLWGMDDVSFPTGVVEALEYDDIGFAACAVPIAATDMITDANNFFI